ncbi:MAG: hypothetical protein ABEH43_03035 [Flavobacteriales bacterium]
MKSYRTLLILVAFTFLKLGNSFAQNEIQPSKVVSNEDKRQQKITIEIRSVKRNERGKFINGKKIRESKTNYFQHNNGTIYKLFSGVEHLLAHYKGFHSKPKATATKHIVYISSFEDAYRFDLSFKKIKSGEKDSKYLEYNRRTRDYKAIK